MGSGLHRALISLSSRESPRGAQPRGYLRASGRSLPHGALFPGQVSPSNRAQRSEGGRNEGREKRDNRGEKTVGKGN